MKMEKKRKLPNSVDIPNFVLRPDTEEEKKLQIQAKEQIANWKKTMKQSPNSRWQCSDPNCSITVPGQGIRFHLISHLSIFPYLCKFPECKQAFQSENTRKKHHAYCLKNYKAYLQRKKIVL